MPQRNPLNADSASLLHRKQVYTSVSLLVPVLKRATELTGIIMEEYKCYQLHSKLYPTSLSQS